MIHQDIILTILIAATIGLSVVFWVRHRHTFWVPPGSLGLLYHEGEFLEILPPGRHVCWGRDFEVTMADSSEIKLRIAEREEFPGPARITRFTQAHHS